MARQPRIEYEGAYYHVMARGDRQEPIFEDERDRTMFLETLDEGCERSGWKIFAWVLMSNHYHLLVQTPEGNLVAGMKWLQNTYTRRLNTRHRKWGHVFGGRYKAVIVEDSEDYLATLMDYIHLNPARAGLIKLNETRGLLAFPWSSLAQGYSVEDYRRAAWLAVPEGLELLGYRDTTRDRRMFLERLEQRAREDKGSPPGHKGLQNTLQRGWYWGSQAFREKLLKMVGKIGNRNYRASELGRQRERRNADEWLQAGCRHFAITGELLEADRLFRLAIAWALHRRTNQPQVWIAKKTGLRTAANVSQQVRRFQKQVNIAPKRGRQPIDRWIRLVKNSTSPMG